MKKWRGKELQLGNGSSDAPKLAAAEQFDSTTWSMVFLHRNFSSQEEMRLVDDVFSLSHVFLITLWESQNKITSVKQQYFIIYYNLLATSASR